MTVHLIKKQTIIDYIKENPRSAASFENWLQVLKRADWYSPLDIVKTFNSADIIGNGSQRIVFNVGGNNHRVIVRYHFGLKRIHLFIKWIGSHKDYSSLCKVGHQYKVNDY
jgi:mRNA interferase HigB